MVCLFWGRHCWSAAAMSLERSLWVVLIVTMRRYSVAARKQEPGAP